MKRHLNLMLATLALLVVPKARASVTITFDAGALFNGAGSALADGSLFMLVADTSRNGFGALNAGSLSTTGFINADDQILGRGFVESSFGTGATASIALQSGAYAQLDAGDPLAMLWFPGLNSSAFSILSGASYGLFTTTTPASGPAWVIPIDGTVNIQAMNLVNDTGAMSGRALLTAIPEPSTYAAILGACALGLAGWRRRRVSSAKQPQGACSGGTESSLTRSRV